jgi:hypothetical protein
MNASELTHLTGGKTRSWGRCGCRFPCDIVGDRILIESISARLFAQGISQEIHQSFFTFGVFKGLHFADHEHKPRKFIERDTIDRPEGLVYYRLGSIVNPKEYHLFLAEKQQVTLTFDLDLEQSDRETQSTSAANPTFPPPDPVDHPVIVTATGTTTHLSPSTASTPRNLFSSVTCGRTDTATLVVMSPAFARSMLRDRAGTTIVTSYHGPLDSMDNQVGFNKHFPSPEPKDITKEPAKLVAYQLNVLVDRCALRAFLHVLREDYVGTIEDMSFEAISAVDKILRQYRMEYSLHGKHFKVLPTAVYMQYLKVIYLLPENSQKWGFSLYNLFMNAVTPKIMKGILASTSYVRTDFRKLVTGQEHRNCLVKLNNEAEKVNKVLREHEDRLRETCRELVGGNRSCSQNRASIHCVTYAPINSQALKYQPVNAFTNHISAAEETIARATGNAGLKHD